MLSGDFLIGASHKMSKYVLTYLTHNPEYSTPRYHFKTATSESYALNDADELVKSGTTRKVSISKIVAVVEASSNVTKYGD